MFRSLTAALLLFSAIWAAVPVQADPVEVLEDCLDQNPCGGDIDDFVCISSPGPYGVSSPYGCIGPCDDSLETYNTGVFGQGCRPLPDTDEYAEVGLCNNGGDLPVGVYNRVGSGAGTCTQNVPNVLEGIKVEPCAGGLRVKVYNTYDECHQDPEPSAGLCSYGEGVFVDSGVQIGAFRLAFCISDDGCVYWYDDGEIRKVVPATCL